MNWKLSTAAVALSIFGAGVNGAQAADAAAAAENSATTVQDVIVTATRREETANRIPLAIQALGGETLQKLGVSNFEQLVEFLPNVRTASHGPGTSSIYIRGLSTDTPGLQILGTAGSQPNVALYLNDAPSSVPGRNLDVYAVDLQRVEVLAGPQGTLFGASAMGGAIRYITNKPDLKDFHSGFSASYSGGSGADPSSAVNAFVNVPIIEDKAAVRITVFSDNQGGYISNVPGTFQMPFDGHVGQPGQLPTGNPLLVIRAIDSCQGVTNCNGSTYNAPSRAIINNDPFVKKNFNDAHYTGGRIGFTYKFNEDWSVDLMDMNQSLKTNGVFEYQPELGDLKVQQFGDNWLKDDWNEATWTVNGRLNMLSLVYTGSYLNRKTEQQAAYSGYSNSGVYLPYYECDRGVYYTAAYNGNIGNKCYSPSKSYKVRDSNKRFTQELRVTTPSELRLRGTGGLFYDTNTLYDNTDWSYVQQAAGFIYPRAPNPVVNAHDPSVRPVGVGFFNDVTRKDRQWAAYGEVSYDIIPKKLIVTGGARYYDERASMTGSSNGSFGGGSRGVYNPATGTYSAAATPPQYYTFTNLASTLAGLSPASYTGTLWKGNLTYKLDDRSLVYATYSEGFRPGGFNRKPCNVVTAACAKLKAYVPDQVKNYEVGWKLSLLDRSLQFNAAAYQIDWSNIQMTVFDQNISNQTFTTNFADARIRGFEGDVTWRATSALTIDSGFSYNDSELTKYSYAKTSTLVPLGSPLALSPKFQGNIRGRYEFELPNNLHGFAQAGYHYVGKTISSDIAGGGITMPGSNPTLGYAAIPATGIVYNGKTVKPGDVIVPVNASFAQPSYSTVSASFGVTKDNTTVEIYGENLTDERPQLYTSANDGVKRVTTLRPLTVGIRFSFKN